MLPFAFPTPRLTVVGIILLAACFGCTGGGSTGTTGGEGGGGGSGTSERGSADSPTATGGGSTSESGSSGAPNSDTSSGTGTEDGEKSGGGTTTKSHPPQCVTFANRVCGCRGDGKCLAADWEYTADMCEVELDACPTHAACISGASSCAAVNNCGVCKE